MNNAFSFPTGAGESDYAKFFQMVTQKRLFCKKGIIRAIKTNRILSEQDEKLGQEISESLVNIAVTSEILEHLLSSSKKLLLLKTDSGAWAITRAIRSAGNIALVLKFDLPVSVLLALAEQCGCSDMLSVSKWSARKVCKSERSVKGHLNDFELFCREASSCLPLLRDAEEFLPSQSITPAGMREICYSLAYFAETPVNISMMCPDDLQGYAKLPDDDEPLRISRTTASAFLLTMLMCARSYANDRQLNVRISGLGGTMLLDVDYNIDYAPPSMPNEEWKEIAYEQSLYFRSSIKGGRYFARIAPCSDNELSITLRQPLWNSADQYTLRMWDV